VGFGVHAKLKHERRTPGAAARDRAELSGLPRLRAPATAKSWELRTSTSLAKLWQGQGTHKEVYELLAPVYAWFTEGFNTKDPIEAKALLGDLRQPGDRPPAPE
jgi:predicted ATPase